MPLAPKEAQRDGVPKLGEHRQAACADRGQPAPVRHDLATIVYTRVPPRRQRRDAQLPHDVAAARSREPRHHGRGSEALVSAARARAERACMETPTFMLGGRDVLRGESGMFATDLSARGRRSSSPCRGGGRNSNRAFPKCRRDDSRSCAAPVLGGIIRKKVRVGLGLDASCSFITGSAPMPPELVRGSHARDRAARALRHDGELRHQPLRARGRSAYRLGRHAGARRTVKLSDDGEVLVKSPGKCSATTRTRRSPRKRSTQKAFCTPAIAARSTTRERCDQRSRQGDLQDGQGQVRRAGAAGERAGRAPRHR